MNRRLAYYLNHSRTLFRFRQLKLSIQKSITKYTFEKYYKKWQNETRFLSSTQAMKKNKNFQKIVKLGQNVVPCIIDQLREEPSFIVMALRAITGTCPEIPEKHLGHILEISNDWIEWYDHVYTRDIFQKHLQQWEKETKVLSSTSEMFWNKNCQAIVDMGWEAVPHIIDLLKSHPTWLFYALRVITRSNPMKPEHTGHLHEIAADWIEWYDQACLKNTFQKYFKKWKKETLNTSSSDDMFENPNYQAIINLGWKVVPFIIEQLKEKPAHLFMALTAITGATPVIPNHVGRLYDMANDWIKWYETCKK
jgi:hypothetical protein